MRQYKKELDVDFIGGTAPLTKEEEKAISEFIKTSKERQQKQASRRKARTVMPASGRTASRAER
jgi:hypothetical protein